jgi:hypothetical protein
MPADFSIDSQRRRVLSRASGVLTMGDLEGHMERLRVHPDFQPTFSQLADFREVTGITFSTDNVRELARRRVFDASSRRAFLVASALHFGLARMFASHRDLEGEDGIGVFMDPGEAESWVSPPAAS